MRIMNAIKRFFKCLLSRMKREPLSSSVSEEFKTFYDIELLENAHACTYYQQMFGEACIPKVEAGEGKEVHFVPYKPFHIDIEKS